MGQMQLKTGYDEPGHRAAISIHFDQLVGTFYSDWTYLGKLGLVN